MQHKIPGGNMKEKLAKIGKILVLASGLALCAGSLLVMVAAAELSMRLTGALVFAAGLIIILLALLVERFAIFKSLHRCLLYLTQNSQYTAGLLREITEVMKAIQEMEQQQEQKKKSPARKAASPYEADLTEDELALESTVRQFES